MHTQKKKGENMAQYSDDEILHATNQLYKQIADSNSATRKADCKFLNRYKDFSDGKYCLATTHKRCSKTCPFFEPTIMAKFRTLVMNDMEWRQQVMRLKARIAILESERYRE